MPKERRRLIINFHHNLGLSQFEFARMRAARTRIEINFTGRLLVSGGSSSPKSLPRIYNVRILCVRSGEDHPPPPTCRNIITIR